MSTENMHKDDAKELVIVSYDGKTFIMEMSQNILGMDGEVIYKVPATRLEARHLLTALSEAPGINDKVKSIMKKIALEIAPENEQTTVEPQSIPATIKKITRRRMKKGDNQIPL